jgi:GNAT superfamily N-acetyltransferase
MNALNPEKVRAFLARFYRPEKVRFLHRHGEWWHRGNDNRWAILVKGNLAAYCAVIPLDCVANGQTHSAVWWVDLIVAPEHRGRGLQSLFDERLRLLSELKLGFPNQLAARIHRKHGWGVRDDFRILLLPLDPRALFASRPAGRALKPILKAVTRIISPAWAALRWHLGKYEPQIACRCENPDPAALERTFRRHLKSGMATTARDVKFLSWRYLEAPYRSQLRFYLAGPDQEPRQGLITRTLDGRHGRVMRVLDFFGDLKDQVGLKDLLRLAVREAIAEGAVQVTAMVSLPELRTVFHSAGFLLSATGRFCWHSHDLELHEKLEHERNHWVLGDSDNDEMF